jgi:hypothetical protein
MNDRRMGDWLPVGGEIFIVFRASRTAVGPTQPALKWVPGAISLPVKGLECEAHHSPSSGEVLNVWSHNSIVAYVLMVSSFIKRCLSSRKTGALTPLQGQAPKCAAVQILQSLQQTLLITHITLQLQWQRTVTLLQTSVLWDPPLGKPRHCTAVPATTEDWGSH